MADDDIEAPRHTQSVYRGDEEPSNALRMKARKPRAKRPNNVIALFPDADADAARARVEIGLAVAEMSPARLAELREWLRRTG